MPTDLDLTTKAQQAWEIFHHRIHQASTVYQPESPLSKEPDQLNFINGQTVEISSDKTAKATLHTAMMNTPYEGEIFAATNMSQKALALYLDHQLTREQISTLLEIEEAKQMGTVHFYPLFAPNSSRFSKEALWYLLPLFQHKANQLSSLDANQLAFFKMLMLQAPLSEQYFYLMPEPLDKQNRFRHFLVQHDAMFLHHSDTGNFLVLPTFSIKNARLIAKAGIQNAVAHVANLGKKTADQIRLGIEHNIRYADLDFPNVPLYDTVHEYELHEFKHLYNTNHDYHHAQVGSLTPMNFRHALLRMVKLLGEFCQRHHFNGFIGRWDLIDQELRYFLHAKAYVEDKQYNEAVFCDFLDFGGGGKTLKQSAAYLFFSNRFTRQFQVHDGYTDLGILVMMDMCENPEDWKKLKIDPEKLTGDYADLYQKVKRIYPSCKNKSDNHKIFALRETFHLTDVTQCLSMLNVINGLNIEGKLIRNNKKATLQFLFTLQLRNMPAFDFFQLIKTEFSKSITDTTLRALFLKNIDLLIELETAYTLEKKRKENSRYSLFNKLIALCNTSSMLHETLISIKTHFTTLKDETCRSVLLLACDMSALHKDMPSKQMKSLDSVDAKEVICKNELKQNLAPQRT